MIPPRLLTFSILLLAGITFSRVAAAQSATSGGLTGVVTDPSNAVVPDAKVKLTDNAKGITQEKRRVPMENMHSSKDEPVSVVRD